MTPNEILKIIDSVKSTHTETAEEIERKYLVGSCYKLAEIIMKKTNLNPDVKIVKYEYYADPNNRDFVTRDHAAIRIKDNENVFDISGMQTDKQMREKLAKIWNVAPNLIEDIIYDNPTGDKHNRPFDKEREPE